MKAFCSRFLLAVLLLWAIAVQAQPNNTNLSAIEATTPLPADQLPVHGTFYSAANPLLPPAPGNIWTAPGWDLGNGIYLLDDLGVSSDGGFYAVGESVPYPWSGGGDGGGYGFTNSYSFNLPTNGLWLWITNVANGTVFANLNRATDFVYEVFSTTNLTTVPAVTNWNIETEVFPGVNTNTMPFTTSTAGRNPLFLWARDWTGITSSGNCARLCQ
jgi:hypothetical protein